MKRCATVRALKVRYNLYFLKYQNREEVQNVLEADLGNASVRI